MQRNEIECRVSAINGKGLSLLLFKDARVDQKILDEAFTPFGWKRSHQSIDGNLYCTVEIWDEYKSQWIAKQDVGTVSYSEKEKGQASDSFKRACFNCVYTSRMIHYKSVAPHSTRLHCSVYSCTAMHQCNYGKKITLSFLILSY
ncbi:hypothetical protein IMSAGC013_01879 [Lachnospiraceae bacterium]|nr:hypothetical protein IMSAGC013_01879 [Lachnospiraceae bacterium]